MISKMPKTKKKFNWEVFDEKGEFLDILTMNRKEAKIYQEQFSNYTLKEINYTDND